MPELKKPSQTIEQLRKRYDELNRDRITADANHKTAAARLDELKGTAMETYGTHDLDALRAKLKEMEAENARKLAEYQSHLDKIETDLKDVDQKFNQPQGQK